MRYILYIMHVYSSYFSRHCPVTGKNKTFPMFNVRVDYFSYVTPNVLAVYIMDELQYL